MMPDALHCACPDEYRRGDGVQFLHLHGIHQSQHSGWELYLKRQSINVGTAGG